MKRAVLLPVILSLLFGGEGIVEAGTINAGDLLVVDFVNGTVDDVNPTSGASFVIASGFSNPQGLAISPNGKIFVSDIGTSTISEINPTTGTVTLFSGGGLGTGPALTRPFQMAFDSSGILFVADGGTPNGNTTGVLAIDPAGNRTLVAGNNGTSNNLFDRSLAGLALNSQGNIYASAPTAFIADGVPPIYQVNTGTASPIPSSTAVNAPQGLAIGQNGQLLAIWGGPLDPSIWSIDVQNGSATVLSDNNGAGTGAAYVNLRGITVAPNGSIYATDINEGNGIIYKVDSMGNRSVVSGNGVGGSTFGGLTYGIAVYPILAPTATPEPASLTLLGLGLAGLAGYGLRWRKA